MSLYNLQKNAGHVKCQKCQVRSQMKLDSATKAHVKSTSVTEGHKRCNTLNMIRYLAPQLQVAYCPVKICQGN